MKDYHLKLVSLEPKYQKHLEDMLEEWAADIAKNKTNHSPYSIFRNDYHDFDNYMENLEVKEATEEKVPDKVFFCLDLDRNIFVGAVNIRLALNKYNYLNAGHIGDGIRPSERGKGYGTAMLSLALKECQKLGLNYVLMVCDDKNMASKKHIEKNGGQFESQILSVNSIDLRYWITINQELVVSERLTMERLIPTHYQDMAAWTLDERVFYYLIGNPVKEPIEVLSWVRMADPNIKNHLLMIMYTKEDRHPVGILGFYFDSEDGHWEISYILRYDDWGKGYTTEGVKAMMNYIDGLYGKCKYKVECADENKASVNIAKKLGMQFDHASEYSKRDGSKTFSSKVFISGPGSLKFVEFPMK